MFIYTIYFYTLLYFIKCLKASTPEYDGYQRYFVDHNMHIKQGRALRNESIDSLFARMYKRYANVNLEIDNIRLTTEVISVPCKQKCMGKNNFMNII